MTLKVTAPSASGGTIETSVDTDDPAAAAKTALDHFWFAGEPPDFGKDDMGRPTLPLTVHQPGSQPITFSGTVTVRPGNDQPDEVSFSVE